MKTQKMSLANLKGKLSRDEMKKIMAGSGEAGCASKPCAGHGDGTCYVVVGGCKCSISQGNPDCA